MPVHVFGNPCDVDAIERIARKYNLKTIYDAAHAIGSSYGNKSILEYGDISATSLHATKLLNTAEGGGCITTSADLHKKLKRIRFFGHNDKKEVVEDGFNGKLTEIHAALGLVNLNLYEKVIQDRKEKYGLYIRELSKIKDLKFQKIKHGHTNYSYFPIIFNSEEDLIKVETALNAENIFPRRYFYPAVNTYKSVVDSITMPIAERIADKILCLPLYYKLKRDDIKVVVNIIRKVFML